MRGDDISVCASLSEIRFRAKYPHMLVSLLHVVERVGAALLKFEHVSRAPDWHDTGELNAWKMDIQLSQTWHWGRCLWAFFELCTKERHLACAWEMVCFVIRLCVGIAMIYFSLVVQDSKFRICNEDQNKQAMCPFCFHLFLPLLKSFELWITCPRALTLIWLCTYILRRYALNRMLHETQYSIQALLSKTNSQVPPLCHDYIF